jgi:hypothetical protein
MEKVIIVILTVLKSFDQIPFTGGLKNTPPEK